MKLKHTKETKILVDYSDFEDLVQEYFNQDYEFVADIECGNDSSHEFNVSGELNEWGLKDIEEFKATGEYAYSASDILNYLASTGEIEKGNYLITVCW